MSDQSLSLLFTALAAASFWWLLISVRTNMHKQEINFRAALCFSMIIAQIYIAVSNL